MTTLQNIYDYIDSFAPYSTQESYDNSGLLVGSPDTWVRVCALAVTATAQTVRQAHELGCDAMLAHHPIMFRAVNRLTPDSPEYLLAHYGMGFLCAHTNLDISPDGVNTALAARLGLADCEHGILECGVLGRLPRPMSSGELARYVCRKLGCTGVRFAGNADNISRIAVIGGSGEDFLLDAAAAGAQAAVTGEAGFHYVLDAIETGMVVITAGHHSTERVVLEPLHDRLSAEFADVRFVILDESEPFITITEKDM